MLIVQSVLAFNNINKNATNFPQKFAPSQKVTADIFLAHQQNNVICLPLVPRSYNFHIHRQDCMTINVANSLQQIIIEDWKFIMACLAESATVQFNEQIKLGQIGCYDSNHIYSPQTQLSKGGERSEVSRRLVADVSHMTLCPVTAPHLFISQKI